ncbi:MAG: arylsulfotransferase (ASST) [Chloroflexi bacterium]|nr:MAG: arylsulfotransferase (ASST) [Chloroflexota bacterium]MBL1194259.1 arylsulfotransferase (ASST) [Chloroflexota bacterium]NOH11551.1 arylsulfotransferase (ASST) [Chloroflexota bacterium]
MLKLHRRLLLIAPILTLVLSANSSFSPVFQEGIQTTAEAYPGYTLFAPMSSTTVYLIDNDGQVVHSWETASRPGNAVYLLENGDLLHTGSTRSSQFTAGGGGGTVELYSWEGELLWSFEYAGDDYRLHHDVEIMPNGNVLMIAWESKTVQEALAAGRDPSLLPEDDAGLWPDHVIEVDPNTDEIVWEWHVWDHLVQDYDPSLENFGVVADHPELIDLNYVPGHVNSDWNHINSIDYNAELDQIMLSVHSFSEIWIIDHSTTTSEAAGHTGGNSGLGGDLLYRWGNPQAYDVGPSSDQQLFQQHDAQWITDGQPVEDNILIFNNGNRRQRAYSSVVEIIPPIDTDGMYTNIDGSAFAPEAPLWEYVAGEPTDFYADHISGAQRLPNGNTLICDGPSGYFFEVTEDGEIVWEYEVPSSDESQSVTVFRAERYSLDYAAFEDKDLAPQGPVPAIVGRPPGTRGPGGEGGRP